MIVSLYASTTGIKWDFKEGTDILSGQVVSRACLVMQHQARPFHALASDSVLSSDPILLRLYSVFDFLAGCPIQIRLSTVFH
jgi:hypothetical protein